MKINKYILSTFILCVLTSCAAKQMAPGAEKVMILPELPEEGCEFVAEVVGSQGNWWTDDVTSTKNKMVGARNEMRNSAYSLGANTILIMESRNTNTALSIGVTNVTVVGNAYKCVEATKKE